MLEKLRLSNFQKHETLDITLDPHVTTIVGRSGAGKSSTLRALRWLLINKPQGKAFIRKGAKKTSVTLHVDGHKIRRTKGDNKNTYKLDGTTLKAFGTNPPKEVSKLLNVDSINIQSQHDPLWWFSLPPGQVTKELNSIVDLSIIDKSLAYIAAKGRSNRAEIQVVEKRLGDARDKRKALLPVLDASKALGMLETSQEAIRQVSLEAQSIERLEKQASTAYSVLASSKDIVRNGDSIITVGEDLERRQTTTNGLKTLLSGAETAEKILSITTPSMNSLLLQEKEVSKAMGGVEALSHLLQDASVTENTIANASACLNEQEARLHKDWGGRSCPLCGSVLEK